MSRLLPAVLIALGVGLLGYAGYLALIPPPEQDLARAAAEDLERRGFAPLSGPLAALVEEAGYDPVPTEVHPLLNRPAPPFALNDVDGKRWTSEDLRGDGPVVLVFYYGYNCNHCVSQLFGLNKDIEKFRELGARVVAVSADPPALTRKRYEKYGAFDFVVLSDEGNKVAEAFDVYRRSPDGDGELMHGTFVLSREGKVAWVSRGDEPFTANRTLLIEVNRLRTAGKKDDPAR
ncbi:MAG: peroxiredoxin family protein [Gemmataceae bacterium]